MKQVLREGRVVFGCALNESRDPGVIFAMAKGGADMVFIDMEHQSTSIETVAQLVAHAHAAGVTPVVRIAQIDYTAITRVLDCGCQSIFIPGIKTRAELEHALDMARYAPLGNRGMNLYGNANVGYEEVTDVAAATTWLNDNLLVGLNVETKEAVENLEDLLIPGVDWALVGLFDLSQSYGIIGQHLTHPLIAEAMTKVRDLCKQRDIAYATFAGTTEGAVAAVSSGASMVLSGGVLDFVRRGTREAATAIRDAPRP